MEIKGYLKQSFSFPDGEYKFGDVAWRKFHEVRGTSPVKVYWSGVTGSFDGLSQSYCSPRWSAELADCSLPMTLDTYSNCSFGCLYCFSQFQRGKSQGTRGNSYRDKLVKSINPEKVAEIFKLERASQFTPYVKDKRAIQWGGLSDQFDGFERKYGKTLDLMRELKKLDYPISFSTKATWIFDDERYVELFRDQKNWNVKFSLITMDEEVAKIIEVGVPSPKKRLEAIRKFTDLNAGGATLRLRPFIIGISSVDYLELIEAAHDAGADAVTTEFMCLDQRSFDVRENFKKISEICGFDILDFYRKYSVGTGYLRLNRKIKEKYIRNMQELCKKLGMRFYVSDAHFKEACDGSCCCGLPDTWNYSRGNFSNALQLCKKNGTVRFAEIDSDMYFLDPLFRGATGMNTTNEERRAKYEGMTLRDYLRYLWNDPSMGQSPFRMFERVMVPDGIDENGDIIYKYNEEATFVR
jgi:DNA repair photolyase